jgi:hypothetical protein
MSPYQAAHIAGYALAVSRQVSVLQAVSMRKVNEEDSIGPNRKRHRCHCVLLSPLSLRLRWPLWVVAVMATKHHPAFRYLEPRVMPKLSKPLHPLRLRMSCSTPVTKLG